MLRFAFRNLLTMRVRTLLAVVGLSIGVTGVVTLWAVSMGLRAMVSATLQKVEGLGVVQKDIFNPMHSVLPTRLAREIEKIPGVRTVVPEIWKPQLRLEGQLVHRGVRLPGVVLLGIDLDQSAKMERGALYRRTIQEGRFLDPSDKDKKVLLLRDRKSVV